MRIAGSSDFAPRLLANAGTTGVNDYAIGFLQDNTPNIGLASGNASIFYSDCNFSLGIATSTFTEAVGIKTLGGWTAGKILGARRAEPAMLHGAIAWLVTIDP